jgi:hypothetical protein
MHHWLRDRLAPDVTSGGNEQVELALLHVEPHAAIAIEGGEAALRTKPQSVQIDDAAGLVDAALERFLGFELGNLGADEADYGDGVARQEAQWREVPGARSVVFEEIAIDVEATEDALG